MLIESYTNINMYNVMINENTKQNLKQKRNNSYSLFLKITRGNKL